ncbi:MAG: hypothetical protein OEV30_09365 [Ignavibacteria bacterium]|nr:hypothetical protein [Ignavibacteria bacterium]
MNKGIAILLVTMSVISCSRQEENAEPQPAHAITQSGATGSVAGLAWQIPERWTMGPEKAMRVATYMSPPSSGDSEGGECAVFYFGSGEGGDVEANINRWVGQFEPDGEPARTMLTVENMSVHYLDLTGTYLASTGPMMGPKERKEGFRLLGAIVGGPQGSVFFKMTGPSATVGDAQGEFQSMIESLSSR